MNVLVWAENKPLPEAERAMCELYPQGIEGEMAGFLRKNAGLRVNTATMADDAYGLSKESLKDTDVLVYWSHKHWKEIPDAVVDGIQTAVLEGMGLVLLHSAHASKIFSRLVGTRTQCLRWHESGEWQRVWNVAPAHQITQGLGESFLIPHDETYGEYFEIPQPDEQVFLTVSQSGEVLRSGDCFFRGRGRIFYFSAGHETYPVYKQPEVQKVICNAVAWASGKRDGKWPVWAREEKSGKGESTYDEI